MKLIKKNMEWVIFALSIIIFIVLAIGVHYDKFQTFDAEIHDIISIVDFPLVDGFWLVITNLASPLFILVLLVVLLIIIRNKKYGILLFLNTINIFLLNQILKYIFTRPRPFDLMLIEETGYSFPSGHTMMALAFYGFLIYVIWQLNLSKRMKKLLTIILVILIPLIGLSRIYLGVHYPSDILGGFMAALAYLIIFIKLVKKYDVRSESDEKSL